MEKELDNNNIVIQTGDEQSPVLDKAPKKRGRKPNPNKSGMYFDKKEEDAFKQFCTTTNQREKDKIFKDTLYPAFIKMTESLIRSKTLFTPGEEFEDTVSDAIGHLMTKVNRFDATIQTKAYSYCGTIIKNYLVHKRKKAQEKLAKDVSYEGVYNDFNQDTRRTYMPKINESDLEQTLMRCSANEISKMIKDPEKYNLNEYDIKVGYALIEILRNWDNIFNEIESKKYTKSNVDGFIKEYTRLNTKQIRDSKKKFTAVYLKLKDKILQNE